jgi:hypothetical protein
MYKWIEIRKIILFFLTHLFFLSCVSFAQHISNRYYDDENIYHNESLIQLTPQQRMMKWADEQSRDEQRALQESQFFTEEEIVYILSDDVSKKSAKESSTLKSNRSFQDVSRGIGQVKSTETISTTANVAKKIIEFDFYDFN